MATGTIRIPSLGDNPADTPASGRIFLYFVGTTLRYKDSSGTIHTVASGVTQEDVEDIVAALIQPGSGKITTFYNDGLGTLSIDVDPTEISHADLQDIGTNSHASIDSHISSTSNPHGVTAAQAGADPAGSAAAAQAYAIQRSNHTGSQLASTITDFASSVLSSVLAGFSVGSNVAITAADTVLSAFEKIQAQINSVVADAAVWKEFSTTADVTTTSNATLSSVSELQFPVVAGRRYYMEVTAVFRTATNTTGISLTMGTPDGADGTIAMQVNIPSGNDGTGAIYGGSITSLGDVVTSTAVPAASPTWFIGMMRGSFICTTSGNLVPQFRSEVNGSTVNFGTGSMILVREFT